MTSAGRFARPSHLSGIVPPRFFERIAREGSPEEREAALRTLAIDNTFRAARVQATAISAASGAVRTVAPHHVGGRPSRTIFDAQHEANPSAVRVLRSEGEPPVADQPANEAYDGLGDTYELYWDVFQRNSIDAAGMPLLGEVHFGQDYDNAFWDGHRMNFGDGDGRLFTGFTRAIDVIGHELTHGVTQHTLGLQYLGQPGALNESISDVFGSLVKQYRLGQTAQEADWLVGAGILGPLMAGAGLRSLKAPGTANRYDEQPATMRDYVATMDDNGGVHLNSGIPNHAFYVAASGIGGPAWEKAGHIWYRTLFDPQVSSSADFGAFAVATIRSAIALFGRATHEVRAVSDAWAEVGVLRRAAALV